MLAPRLPAILLYTLFSALVVTPFTAAADHQVKIGERIANLNFKDIHYLPRSLDDFQKKKAFVVIFTTTTCPVVERYLPELRQLEKNYRAKGVQFIAVDADADDSILAVASQAVLHDMEFPFVKDSSGACVRALAVERTPEVAVLDEQRRLRYRGRIDDQNRLGGTRAEATRRDLKEALDAVLAGREVAVKETPVDGCVINLPEARSPKKNLTFAEHVAPIMRKHCQECHRPGTAAPFSLITYKQVASKASTIAEVVAEGRMPPWYGSAEFGHFTNRRSLSSAEIDTLVDWARTGMTEGDEKKFPVTQPDPQQSKWLIGAPDLVVPAPKHDLPAAGEVAYKYVILPYMFLSDTWMQGIQILPDNPRVLHHCNMAYVIPGEGFKQDNFITGTVPGGSPMMLDHGVGFKIPKGAGLVLQVHYVTTGKPEKCQIRVGFKYAKGGIDKQLRHTVLGDNKFAIPPGAPAHPVAGSKTLDQEAVGVGLFVHMHLRGKDMTFRAHYPDGTSELLLLVPNYSFDWQIPYVWEVGKKRFPKGTRLEAVAHYDNSQFNPYNPDPSATVRDGPQTRHEMMNGYVFYTNTAENLNLDIDPRSGQVRAKR